jgi:hypothetical protein
LNPWNTMTVCLCKLCEWLFAPDILFPKIQMFTLRSSPPLKLKSAAHTFVSLNSSPLPVSFYWGIFTSETLFL